MSTILDYVGRTYDAAIFHGVSATQGSHLLTPYLANEAGGEICTGVVKLMQRVLLRLNTPLGSMPFAKNEGTELITAFRQGRVRTEADVHTVFGFAASHVLSQCARDDDGTLPDDERLTALNLVAVELDPDVPVLTIELVTAAGASRILTLPISTHP